MSSSEVNIDEIKNKIILKEKYWVNIYSTNCYAFALGLDIPEKDMPFAYQPGSIYCHVNGVAYDDVRYNRYEKNLLLDLEALELEHEEADPNENTTINISYDENGNAIVEYSWLIALLKSEQRNDYHFLRKTPNGIWYHKQGWTGCPDCHNDSGTKILRDPTIKHLFYHDEYVNTYRLKLTKKS